MSATLKVHGFNRSTATRRVLAALEELHVPYEFVSVDLLKGAHKEAKYVDKYQPFGQVPALEDSDGTTLFESRAILRYVALKYGKGSHSLYPTTDLPVYAQVEKWLNVESDEYNPKVAKIVYETVFKKVFGRGEPDHKLVEELLLQLGPVLDVIERHLESSKNEFLAGKHVTIADLSYLPFTEIFVANPDHARLIEARPHVAAWWHRLRGLTSWQKILKQYQ